MIFALCSLQLTPTQAQVNYEIEAQILGTRSAVPFWMRSNQNGSIPVTGALSSFIGQVKREYVPDEDSSFKRKLWDWGLTLEGRVNANIQETKFTLIQSYLKGRVGPLEMRAGRSREIMGLLGDSVLTTGSFSVSGNAPGIPKLELSIPDYYRLPFLKGLLSMKGSFAHGWVGNTLIGTPLYTDELGRSTYSLVSNAQTFFHQKSLYASFGKEDWPWRIKAGFNHQAYWGNEAKIYGEAFKLNKLESFPFIVTGKPYGGTNNRLPRSKVGNHLGSIDFAVEGNLNKITFIVYRQNFYDVGALYYLANLRDGLNGIVLKNNHIKNQDWNWNTFSFEFLYSKNQAGEFWSPETPSGDEDYYNNYIYAEGWSYKKRSLGNPFFTTREDMRSDLVNDPRDYFINNRVMVLYFGTNTTVKTWNFITHFSFSQNFGTFSTSKEGRTTGEKRYPPIYGLFNKTSQYSLYVKGSKEFKDCLQITFFLAADKGGLLTNSEGIGAAIKKRF